jgi:hypothetical protein
VKFLLDVSAHEYAHEKMIEICDVLRWRTQRDEVKILSRVENNGYVYYIVGHGDCLAPNAEWRPIIELDMF